MNRPSKVLTFFIVFLAIFGFAFVPDKVRADEEEEAEKIYCPLCEHQSDDDPLYNKERQFYQKIRIIKMVFGDAIDEVALAAAVLHRYDNPEFAYEREYDENFNSSSYMNTWTQVKDSKTSSVTTDGEVAFTEEQGSRIEANEKLDLITTAAIVMIDSNHLGSYSDVCFKDGLSGDGLVGNTGDNGSFVKFFNALFCGGYTILEAGKTPLDFVAGFFSGDNYMVSAESAKRKLVNIDLVCKNGYVGGLYNGVYNIKNDNRKSELKKLYAQQIIDFANYYRKLYSKYEEEENSCVNTISNAGEFANWKQYDDRWKDVQIGSSTVGRIGCLVTSVAIQISRSGTRIGSLPSGQSEFNPGALAISMREHGGFDDRGNMLYTGTSEIAPNLKFGGYTSVGVSDSAKLAEIIGKELSTAQDGKYQKYLVLDISHSQSSMHWVAVDEVSNGVVKIFDPAGSGNTLDDNYTNWIVKGYKIMYMTDVMQGQTGSSSNSGCTSGDNMNRLLAFIGSFESGEEPEKCNFQGRGEGTGYLVTTLPNDPGGPTTAFGITQWDVDVANKIGYTTFLDELFSGCTEKKITEDLYIATMDDGIEWTQGQLDQIGLTVSEHELHALMSVNYGGIKLAVPIMEMIKAHGRESEQVYRAFQNSFSNMSYADGLMRRRMSEFELFRTANYEAESTQYLGWSNIYGKALAMSMAETVSHFPTHREELANGYEFAPISGSSVGSGSGTGELVCKDGKAVRDGSSTNSTTAGLAGVVECAKQQLGKQYIRATHGPDTFDCSGLTYYCYMQALNVDITAGSVIQWDDHEHFTDVASVEDLVPGDIIASNAGGHVQIYIGNGEVIHASSPSVGVIKGSAYGQVEPVRYKHYKG